MFAVSASLWAVTPGALEVVSDPGEPFRAQLELSDVPAGLPLSTLQVRLASPQAYLAAGDQFPQALEGLQLVSAVLRAASVWTVLQAPGSAAAGPLRLRIEVSWSGGRRLAVYDVPVRAGATAQPASDANASLGTFGDRPGTLQVSPGDTLWALASRLPSSGMSLNQKMVALYRANPQAFAGNLNLLRAGSVLKVPPAEQIAAVDASDAAQTLRVETEEFESRRRMVAQQPLSLPQQASQGATGAVQAIAPPADGTGSGDRLRLVAPGAESDPAVQISAQAAEQDARRRESEIRRTNEMLQRLQQGQPANVATGAATAPTQPAPVSLSQAAAAATSVTAATAAKAVTAPAAASTASSAAAVPPALAIIAAAASAAAPAAQAAQTLEQGLLDQDWALGAAIALVVVLVALALGRLLRRGRSAVPETTFLPSQYADDPVLLAPTRPPGETASDGSMQGPSAAAGALTLEQALAAFDASGEIDPVAEAEVYMAYGRDAQAQEILTEAMQADPSHLGVQVKLLEIFVRRKEREPALALLRRIRARSGGEGGHWQKASALAQSMGLLSEAPGEGADARVRDPDHARFAVTMPAPEEPGPARPQEHSPQAAPSSTAVPEASFARSQAPLEVVLEADIPMSAGDGGADASEAERAAAGLPKSSASDHERKLALAEEFSQIGDPQAARDLLQEVIEQADPDLAARARAALDRIA